MAITIKSLGGGRGCCGLSRGVSGLGDAVMTLQGFRGLRGLGVTSADFRPRTSEVVSDDGIVFYGSSMYVAPDPYLTFQPMAPDPTPGTVLIIEPPPPDSSGLPSVLAPTGAQAPQVPVLPSVEVPQPPPVAAPAGDAPKIKVALAIGGTLVIAALIMRGGR